MLKSEEIRWFALRVGTRQQQADFRSEPGNGCGLFSPLEEARHNRTGRQTGNFPAPPELAGLRVLGIVRFENGLNQGQSLVYAVPAAPIGTYPIYQSQPTLRSCERVRLSYGPHTGLEGNLEQVNKPLRVNFGGPLIGRTTEAV